MNRRSFLLLFGISAVGISLGMGYRKVGSNTACLQGSNNQLPASLKILRKHLSADEFKSLFEAVPVPVEGHLVELDGYVLPEAEWNGPWREVHCTGLES